MVGSFQTALFADDVTAGTALTDATLATTGAAKGQESRDSMISVEILCSPES